MENDVLVELKQIELDMLKEFIGICKNHGFRYFLIGGTALGAVRHQGFIPLPWIPGTIRVKKSIG